MLVAWVLFIQIKPLGDYFWVISVGLSSPGGYAGCIHQRLRPELQRVQAAPGSYASRKTASAAGTRGLGAAPDLVQLIFASFLGRGSSPQLARGLAYPVGAPQRKNCIQELGNFGIFGCQSVLGSRIWIPSCLRSGHVVPGVFFAGSGRTKPCVPGKWPAFSARLRAARFPSRSGALESCRGMVFTVFPAPPSAGLASFGSTLSRGRSGAMLWIS